MELFHQLILIVTGIYLLLGTFTMHTENLFSSMVFKVIPFFLGIGCLFSVFYIRLNLFKLPIGRFKNAF